MTTQTKRRRKVLRTKSGLLVQHGTENAYNNHRCRCKECRAAWSQFFKEWTHRTGRARPQKEVFAERRAAVPHGSQTMYARYGCRCDECRAFVARDRNRFRDPATPRDQQCEGCGRDFTEHGLKVHHGRGTCSAVSEGDTP